MSIVWGIFIVNILDFIIYKNEKEYLESISEGIALLGGCQASVIGINFFINMGERNNLLEIYSFSIFIVLIFEFIKLILILKIPENKLGIGIFRVKIFCFLCMSILLIQKII